MKNFQIILLEPNNCDDFYPFSETHCIWEIRCGALRIYDKIKAIFPNTNIAFNGRTKHIASFLKRENLQNQNKVQKDVPILLIYANVIVDANLVEQIKLHIEAKENETSDLYFVNNKKNIIALFSHNQVFDISSSANAEIIEIENARKLNYLWNVFDHQFNQIVNDISLINNLNQVNTELFQNVIFENAKNIFLGENVKISSGVILDATDGPIIIDKEAHIMHGTVILGPCYIGEKTIIKIGAKIYQNCSFGRNCKIGGEIESSIFHSFSNKQHDGFLGHSYICDWVNLGANTNNSDLKNNYSNVKMRLPHKEVTTNQLFLGLFMGDHTKTAINTIFSTGTVVGASTMIATNTLLPKFIPSLKWIFGNIYENYMVEKAIQTAIIIMKRRNKALTDEEIALFYEIQNSNHY